MPLAAAQVVDLIAARLAPTAAGGAPTDRAHPIAQGALPMWRVYAADESIQLIAVDGLQEHDLLVLADGLVTAVSGIDDAMNNLANAGLAAVHATHLARNVTLRNDGITRAMAPDAGADVAKVTLRLRAQFFTYAAAPDTLA